MNNSKKYILQALCVLSVAMLNSVHAMAPRVSQLRVVPFTTNPQGEKICLLEQTYFGFALLIALRQQGQERRQAEHLLQDINWPTGLLNNERISIGRATDDFYIFVPVEYHPVHYFPSNVAWIPAAGIAANRLVLIDDCQMLFFAKIIRSFQEFMHNRWQNEIRSTLLKPQPRDECPVCFEDFESGTSVVLPCGHIVCNTCLLKIRNVNPLCPICRAAIPADFHPQL